MLLLLQADTLNQSARLLQEANGDVKVADAKLRPVRFSVVLERQRSRLSSQPDVVPPIEEEDGVVAEEEEEEAPLYADADEEAEADAISAEAHAKRDSAAAS